MKKYEELRRSAHYVTTGSAKLGEVSYGDDGIDMARDIAAALGDCDRMEIALREIRSRLNNPGHPGSVALQIHRLIDNALADGLQRCRGCGAPLAPDNFDKIADGCPCNTPRGINHGIVPKNTCTCDECDPASTGSIRKA